MPLSERRELADLPETDDTEEAVDTERSSCGTALRASDGETHGSGEEARSSGGGDDVAVSSAMIGVGSCEERKWMLADSSGGDGGRIKRFCRLHRKRSVGYEGRSCVFGGC